MESQLLICFALAFLFFSGARSTTLTIKNRCRHTIWPATLTGAGAPQLSSTGFELASGASKTLSIPSRWSGRVWARSHCHIVKGKFICGTADCASDQVSCNGAGAIPPASLAEFTLSGYKGQDFYDVSLVDGFNLPISITPLGGSVSCKRTSCRGNINRVCPPAMAVRGHRGRVIACKSACLAFNQPQYCCTGNYGTPDKCPPTNYSKIFKHQCPQAYSYAYDDKTSTFTCTGGANYLITFCA